MATEKAKRLFLSRERQEPLIPLITIDHPDLDAPIRICANSVGDDIVSNGETYVAAPIGAKWISDTGEAPKLDMMAVNVDGVIGRALDGIDDPCTVEVVGVLPSDPDEIEIGPITDLELRNCRWDSIAMTGELGFPTVSDEAWPYLRVVPRYFAALFR